MNAVLNSTYVMQAVPMGGGGIENVDPSLLVFLGAGIAALIFVVALRFVFAIVSGIAEFAERLVGGLVKGMIGAGGIGLVVVVVFVVYVVTYVLPGTTSA